MTIVRNILAVVAGLVLGSIVNMAIITVGPAIIPPPPGLDLTTPEGLAVAMPQLQPQHFLPAFLAHALGTLVGALAAYLIAASRKATFAYAIGILFLIGGITAAFLLPAPTWFVALDLIAAYIPTAWLATMIGRTIQRPV